MSQFELLELVVKILNELDIDYMLVGSHASSFYGEARSTHDIDLVIDLPTEKIPKLISRIDPERYYLSESALREGRMANIIDTRTGDKVDLFFLARDVDSLTAFSRRSLRSIMGLQIAVASPEDIILSKLKWSELIGGSPRQLHDVREILRYQKGRLDLSYLEKQAQSLNLASDLMSVYEGIDKKDDAS